MGGTGRGLAGTRARLERSKTGAGADWPPAGGRSQKRWHRPGGPRGRCHRWRWGPSLPGRLLRPGGGGQLEEGPGGLAEGRGRAHAPVPPPAFPAPRNRCPKGDEASLAGCAGVPPPPPGGGAAGTTAATTGRWSWTSRSATWRRCQRFAELDAVDYAAGESLNVLWSTV